jgi:glycerol-3-phosphate acyltransferase PlsY
MIYNPSIHLFLLLLISYITGSFPTAVLIGKKSGKEIRELGSGNPGATNTLRVFGWKPALIVLLIDGFKGWLPAFYFAEYLFQAHAVTEPGLIQIMCGFAAVLGHTYPMIGRFKGGKGIATLGGVLLAIYPMVLPICIGVFAMTVMITGMVSLGSILASVSVPIFLLVIPAITQDQAIPLSLLVFSLLLPWFIIFTHRSNISRIRSGNENRLNNKKINKQKKKIIKTSVL